MILTYQSSGHHIDPRKMAIVVWHDAAFQGERKKRTQGGYFIGLTQQDQVSKDQIKDIHWISWHSSRLTRVVQSTFAAEAMAAHGAWMKASHLAAMWQECIVGKPPSPDGKVGTDFPRIITYTDAMALRDHLHSPRMLCLDRRLGALVADLKDMMEMDGITNYHVRTHLQLADCLTKQMEPNFLMESLASGTVRIFAEATAAKPSRR